MGGCVRVQLLRLFDSSRGGLRVMAAGTAQDHCVFGVSSLESVVANAEGQTSGVLVTRGVLIKLHTPGQQHPAEPYED